MPGDELQMRDYLLGKLSSEERADVEDRYFSDERYFAELRKLEKKLIREYLRDRLDTSGRDEFESALARLPGLRRKIARQAVLTWKPLQVALVAACLVAAISGVWRYGTLQKSDLQSAKQEVADLRQKIEMQRSAPPAVALLFALRPGALRSDNPSLNTPPDVTTIRFRLHVPPDARFLRCNVALRRTGATQVIASSGELNLTDTPNGKAVDFDCAARLLPRGDYTLTLSPIEFPRDFVYRFFSFGS